MAALLGACGGSQNDPEIPEEAPPDDEFLESRPTRPAYALMGMMALEGEGNRPTEAEEGEYAIEYATTLYQESSYAEAAAKFADAGRMFARESDAKGWQESMKRASRTACENATLAWLMADAVEEAKETVIELGADHPCSQGIQAQLSQHGKN